MLTEIKCSEFKSKGQPRPPIVFSPGLNTVLGDQVGSNSIGKSTFLMIVDFAFGGDDYVVRSTDVQRNIGRHTVQFAFKFGNVTHYYSRDTVTHNEVNKCDAEYNILERQPLKEFRNFLLTGYAMDLSLASFRDAVTRYFRVYGRDNLDEKHPLRSVSQESEEDAIASLMKLFDMYSNVDELRKALKEAQDKFKVYKKSMRFDFIPNVTKSQRNQNERQIAELTGQLEQITSGNKTPQKDFFSDLEAEDAKRISAVKTELAALRRQRSRLESKLVLIRQNQGSNNTEFQGTFTGLQTYFPSVEVRKLQEIEGFHRKLQNILEEEFLEEQRQTETLLAETVSSIQSNEALIENEGVPVGVSKAVFDNYADIKKRIAELEKDNAAYQQSQQLRTSVVTIMQQLDAQQSGQLRELQNIINVKMDSLNSAVYKGLKKAPILTLSENGKKYVFETPDDTGTGTSYKGLVVFDLSVLALTPLPALIHDSVVLKQIADDPLEHILDLYQSSGKQVFIALDKGGSYTKRTQAILEQTAVLRLADNGDELFGRSWNTKDAPISR